MNDLDCIDGGATPSATTGGGRSVLLNRYDDRSTSRNVDSTEEDVLISVLPVGAPVRAVQCVNAVPTVVPPR